MTSVGSWPIQAAEAWAVNGRHRPDSECICVRGSNGLEKLTGMERHQFFVTWFHLLRAAELLHYCSLEGMVEQRIWRGFQRQSDELIRYPGVQQ